MPIGNLTFRLFRRIIDPILDFVYPPLCLGCELHISPTEFLCPSCFSDVITLPFDDETSRTNLDAISIHVPASLLYVGYEFEPEGIIATCIHAMKYRNMHRIGLWFGRLLGERFHDTPIIDADPIIVPVPLHKVKKHERGYNQAEYIAKGIKFETGLESINDALIRTRYTESQAASKLDQSRRRQNMRDAFIVNPRHSETIRRRPLILVDDLITTGATMGECANALFENGAQDVRFAAIAKPAKS